MPTVLITGANKGIGFEIARQLGLQKWHVIMAARDRKRGEEAAWKLRSAFAQVTFVQMDVSEPASIREAFDFVSKFNDHLDVLINNAAILEKSDRDLLIASPELLQKSLNTNALGALWVTQTFLPLLKKDSRIIMLSSSGGSMTDPVGGWSPSYCVSKSALNAITRHLAFSLQGKGVTVNAMDPGWVKTDMGGGSATREIAKGAETAVWLASEAPAGETGKFWRDKLVIPW